MDAHLILAYTQYKRYVALFHYLSSHFVLKASLVGWGIPMVIVILVLSTNRTAYVPNTDNYEIYYPSGYALYFGVMAPISSIILANILIFVLIVKSLVTKDHNKPRSHYDISTVWSQLRLSIFLFFLLGLTWIFAVLSMTKR